MNSAKCLVTFLVGLPIVLILACDSRPDTDMSRPSQFGFQKSVPDSLIDEGKIAYVEYCAGCHGVNGDGKGEAAVFLNPKPRDFVTANFKFSSTRFGELPTDEDLKRTLRNGLKGSAMPPFGLLSDRTLDSLVAYIKTLSPKWMEREPTAPIPFFGDPYASPERYEEAVRRGEMVYHGFATCWSCHPAYVSGEKVNEYLLALGGTPRETFRDAMDQPEGKLNEEGEMLYPPDFRRDFIRAGMTVRDLYRSISTGITGTAMPTWVDSMKLPGKNPGDPPLVTHDDLWAIAYYVQSLIAERPPLLDEKHAVVRDRPRPIYLHGEPPKPMEPPPTDTGPAVDFDF